MHLALPARRVEGYARDEESGAPLRYRLNGSLVFAVSMGLWLTAGYTGVMPWDWLWQHRWSGAAGAFVLSLAITAAVVFSTPDKRRSIPADLFLGRRANPQMFGGRADAKMLLYLVRAIFLELNLLSFAAHQLLAYPDDPSPGVVLYVALFSWFVCDYVLFERVHLYTYDLVAERLGFKLVWGCLAWYPYFYAVGLWSVADLPNRHHPPGCSSFPPSHSSPAGRWRAARTCRNSPSRETLTRSALAVSPLLRGAARSARA